MYTKWRALAEVCALRVLLLFYLSTWIHAVWVKNKRNEMCAKWLCVNGWLLVWGLHVSAFRNLLAGGVMENAGLEKRQVPTKISRVIFHWPWLAVLM